MATKYICDGCDKDIVSGCPQNVSVKIEIKGGPGAGDGYELCKSCVSNLISLSNPKSWARYAPPPAALKAM